ncbi:MAG: hypothetical protein HY842_18420 [Bacteroidetes bacterium]|nr:hypothetical protein [Bacteroidota bacterium]
MPFGMLLSERGTLHVMLLDGGQLTLTLPPQKLRLASKHLHRLLPHASFGYSEERRQQFETDPALLVRE